MADLTRRKFLTKGSVGTVGAIGALTAGPAVLAAAAKAATTDDSAGDDLAALDGPLFVNVRDAATGEVEFLVDERSVVVTDKPLVSKLRRAAE